MRLSRPEHGENPNPTLTTLSHAKKLLEGWEGGLPCSLTSLPTHNPLQSHVEAAILRDKEAGRSLKIMMKMGPMTKINGTCQGPSSGGVDVAPLKAGEPHLPLPPALPRCPRAAVSAPAKSPAKVPAQRSEGGAGVREGWALSVGMWIRAGQTSESSSPPSRERLAGQRQIWPARAGRGRGRRSRGGVAWGA